MLAEYRNYMSFHILLLFFVYSFLLCPQELLAQSPNGTGNACDSVNCGQGKCVVSTGPDSFLGIDCICNDGWKKMQLGPITFPACTIPNCTLTNECGTGAPPPPPPPPPATPPPFNLSIPCSLVWCGDGNCIADGLGYSCKCNEGSDNLLQFKGAACFKQCHLGADCKGVTLGSPPSQSGNSVSSPPGSNQVSNSSPTIGHVAVLSLCLILFLGSKLT